MSKASRRGGRHDVNLWAVPLKMSLAAVLLFAITLTPDMLASANLIHIPDWFTMGGIDDARAILSAMLGCVSTVLALIFSVALLVLSMVANLFGPRLLYRFVQDWVTQVCIGLFMGAFIYVFLVFLVTHQDAHTSFIPQVSLITSWFVVLAAFSFLVFYSHRVAMLIQNPDAIGRIVDDLRRMTREECRLAAQGLASEAEMAQLAEHERTAAPVIAHGSGYMQWVDRAYLVALAEKFGAVISMPQRPGQFVLEGEALARVSPPAAAAQLKREVVEAIKLGRHRVLEQDIEFGVAQIVEIGIRALSPAINDTFTGIACVDLLGESLVVLSKAPLGRGAFHDGAGALRLVIRPLMLSRLIRQAFDQIRQAAADNPAVSIRLLTTITRLAERMHAPEDLSTLREQAAAVRETAYSKAPVAIDREDIERAYLQAEAMLVGQRSA